MEKSKEYIGIGKKKNVQQELKISLETVYRHYYYMLFKKRKEEKKMSE